MSEPEPEPRAPAPGRLSLVQEFVNSVELPDGEDELATADQATRWLGLHQTALARPMSEAERRRLVNVREELRVLLTAHAGSSVDQAVFDRLTHLLNGARVRTVISAQGATLAEDAPGAAGFLAEISAAIVEATVSGTWDRLKVCRDDECRWAFYDHSKNGRGAWCSMRVCGCRAKSRAYRTRHKLVGAQANG
jgi:predicted RNA-binding Zn ribbon-like protein